MLKRLFQKLFIERRKEIPFIIFFSFLITFALARLIAFSIHHDVVPELLFFVRTVELGGFHIHHFNFGIFLLIVVGFLSLVDAKRNHIRKVAVLFGVGLALIMDEFGMLVTLEDVYWTSRINYDAVTITALILLNVAYFRGFWKVMGAKIKKLTTFKKGL